MLKVEVCEKEKMGVLHQHHQKISAREQKYHSGFWEVILFKLGVEQGLLEDAHLETSSLEPGCGIARENGEGN